VSTASVSSANTGVSMDHTTAPSRHTTSADTYGRNTNPADNAIAEYELPPPPPAPAPHNCDMPPIHMCGAAQSSSSHPSHLDKVVDKSLSGLNTRLPHSSGKVINKESIRGQYTEFKTSTDRTKSDILQCALQDLATVYHLLQGADQHKLCSPDNHPDRHV
jgi:hypothetical protein